MDLKHLFFTAEDLTYLELFVRTTILYFVLFLADKALGFRQPGIITPYNFLVAAGISHIASSRMVQPQSRPIDSISIIVVYILFILLISYSYLKLSPYFSSKKQVVLVENGRVKKDILKKSMLTIDNLFSILRQKNIFELKNVDYVIAEPNGVFSVAQNAKELPVTKSIMGIPTTPTELSRILIYEGKIDTKVLHEKNLTTDWVHAQLKKQNITDVRQVFIGLLTGQGELYIN
ncbi:DUF421 domain-containing protein [Fictibacillus aquaticus]|uniref:YetF C-terminal domain-containing protein n=1 Tax=Fictibacillus aquaticus TaxID=2021314 RepID=A0A235F6X0_9BACL|nr:YetF domain-containing protein [Fictibacillus aquaticus]OYD56697.1 hypothetical protein CGZ90_16955 [Fictibacillus aquaticus]